MFSTRLVVLFLLLTLAFSPLAKAQQGQNGGGWHLLQVTGLISVLGGTGLVLGSFNWSNKCQKGLETSYLGYDCYADTEKRVSAKLGQPVMLYSGIGAITGGIVMAIMGRKLKMKNQLTLKFSPQHAHFAYRW